MKIDSIRYAVVQEGHIVKSEFYLGWISPTPVCHFNILILCLKKMSSTAFERWKITVRGDL